MGNVARIIREDFRRMFMIVVSVVITIGLVLMPSLFAWYNVLACWDVFDNTGKLQVAVASEDVGYKGDLLPVTITIGDRVISGLRGNDDIGWVITTSDDALDGARSGKYYAAVIIPESFSEDLLRYCFGGSEQARIIYYSNEKASAIAPKITDQGADAVSDTINTVLVESVSEVLLSTVDSIWQYAKDKGVDERIMALPEDFRLLEGRVDGLADTLAGYAVLASDTASLAKSAADLVYSLRDNMASADGVVGSLGDSVEGSLTQLRASLEDTLASVEADLATIPGMEGEAASRMGEARAQAAAALSTYRSSLQPAVDALKADIAALKRASEANLEDFSVACDKLASRLLGLSSQMAEAASQLDDTVARLRGTADMLARGAARIEEALGSDSVDALRRMLSGDVEALSSALTEPVGIERVAIYPTANFGSAMAPLYSTLALFIGALLIMVIVKPQPADEVVAQLNRPRRRQICLGHYAMVLFLTSLQAIVMALGNMFFLGVQVTHPWLYLLCFWAASATFSLIIYTLVALFANLGKALAVILLIMQVTGCGGSFPLELLPGFVNALSPFLPATHVVAAMRAAMMGIYAGDFWMSLASLAAFGLPFLVAGMALSGPCAKLVTWYLRRVEASKLVN